MSDWPTKSVGDLATFHRGITWASSQETEKPEPGCVPVLRIPNVQERLDTTSILFLRGISLDKRSRYAATRDWLLMVGSNGNPDRVGDCVRITHDTDYLFASFLVGVEPNKQAGVDPCFLHYLLRSDSVRKAVSDSIKGTTGLRNISLSHLAAHELSCPPPAQQRKIARVLTTVDNLIEKTEALIAKYQAIKQGMMHDLFTRGVDEHGHLRPPYEQAPELYKQSELGWIPKEWDAKYLKDLYAVPSRNGLYKPSTHYGSGQPMIHMPQMFRGSVVDVTDAARVNVSDREIGRFGLMTGDILFARRSLTLEGAGQCSLVPTVTEPTTFESSIIRVRLNHSVALPSFVNQFFNTVAGYKIRLPFIRQVAVSGVSAADIASLILPCPKRVEEQAAIMGRLFVVDNRLGRESRFLQKLLQVKTGLMQDLLTGKVRVIADESGEVARV